MPPSKPKAPENWVPPVRGVTEVVGFPDSGKTTFATTVPGLFPADYDFYDYDGKSQGDADDLREKGHPYGSYHNMLNEIVGMKPLEVFNLQDKYIKESLSRPVPPKCIVFDNWAPIMEEAIRAKAVTIMSQISDISEAQQRNMSMLTWPASYKFYAQWLSNITATVPMVIICCHVKPFRVGAVKVPGVWEAKGQDPLVTLPVFRVWLLTSSAYGGAPIGVVMKRLKVNDITSEGLVPVNATPLKLSPCTWARVNFYKKNPVGTRQLTEEEIPDGFQNTLIGGELLPDQKVALRVAMELSERSPVELEVEELSMQIANGDMVAAVKKANSEGKSPPAIFTELKSTFPDLTIPKVVQILQ